MNSENEIGQKESFLKETYSKLQKMEEVISMQREIIQAIH